MSFLDNLRARLGLQKIIHVNLDPNSLSSGQVNEALAKENATLKGQILRKEAEEAKERESQTDVQQENEAKLAVNQRYKEIRANQGIQFFSFKNFFAKCLADKKFSERLKILTWDRGNVISKFNDLGFSNSGEFVLLGENNRIILKGKELRDIFQSPTAIETDVMTGGNFVVNLDKEGGYVENIQTVELHDYVPDGRGGFIFSAKKRPLYEYVQSLRDEVGELSADNQEKEVLIKNYEAKLNSLQRDRDVLQEQYQLAQTDVSDTRKAFSSFSMVAQNTMKELDLHRTINANNEQKNEALLNAISTLTNLAEREVSKVSDEKEREKINNSINMLSNLMTPIALQREISQADKAKAEAVKPTQSGENS